MSTPQSDKKPELRRLGNLIRFLDKLEMTAWGGRSFCESLRILSTLTRLFYPQTVISSLSRNRLGSHQTTRWFIAGLVILPSYRPSLPDFMIS